MKNMSLGAKLIGGFVFIAVIALIIGLIGWWGVSRLADNVVEIGEVRLPSVESLLIMEGGYETLRVAQRSLLNPELDEDARQRQFDNIDKARARYTEAMEVYAPLPQTREEARLWDDFLPALEDWRDVNDQFFAAVKDLEKTDITNPTRMQRNIQHFRADHYALEGKVCNLIMNGTDFKGGEDPAKCAFGQWMATYQTDNPRLRQILAAVRDPHDTFHHSVGDIKKAIAAADIEKAKQIYNDTMIPAAHEVFNYFDDLLQVVDEAHDAYVEMNRLAMVDSRAKQKEALDLLERIIHINDEVAAEEVEAGNRNAGRAKLFSILGMVVGFVVALAFGIILAITLTKALTRIIAGLRTGSEQVASASGQVSQSSQQMAEGASEQASSLEEVSSSLEEMTSMTRQNADNAKQASKLMEEAKNIVSGGMKATERMSSAIDAIKTSSDETAKIIKTIDEIAFQTNLLALNAAVEAARAGEAGKGFAVVAEEVRNLAQRSAEAAKSTSNMIEGSQQNAENGVAVSSEVSESLKQIVDSASKVANLVGEVSAASYEQAQGIEQVNIAVAEMDKVVQNNAANAEESASASEELSSQAQELNGMVSDLVGVVGGSSDTQGGGAVQRQHHAPAHQQHYQQRQEHKQTHNLLGQGQKKKNQGAQKSRPAKAEEVIPLEDDDFKDF
jgi:methyl-accepting chemotaxis protein